jgi:predicted nucleotidyltransferase
MIRENKKLPANITEMVPKVIDAIADDPDVSALFSFGSLAEGRLTPLSDLDFAVLISSRLSKRERFEKHIELIGVFNSVLRTDEIDLVVLNDAPLKFSHQILKTGKLLHISNRFELIDFSEKKREAIPRFSIF